VPIRFVYFDLDDTLLDHRAAERAALADTCERFPAVFAQHELARVQETYHAGNVPLWHAYADGTIGKATLQRERFARLLAALGSEADSDEVGAHYLSRYGERWCWIRGAEAAYHAVADAYPVGLLTNGFAEQQRGKLAKFPVLAARASAVVISEEVGAMKPSPAIFEHAQALAHEACVAAPGEILYVGDSLRSDVRGGLAAGWQVAWYRGDAVAAPSPAVFCFDDFADLLAHLGLPQGAALESRSV
jgi:HAD superfamily hydrolase (TIGR01549 family)